MPVFRIEKTSDFTVMSNHHLRNKGLSLRAKGLLSQMLSLPPDWDYTLAGLAAINLEGIDAIREAVKELERGGYVTRERQRDASGRLGGCEYVIRERPALDLPTLENPTLVKPVLEEPVQDPPTLENPTQLNKERLNTEVLNKDCMNHSFNQSVADPAAEAEEKRKEREDYRQLIRQNIEYEYLTDKPWEYDEIDEIIEIMLDAICSTKSFLRIEGSDMPKEVVKSRFLKLNSEHIRFVIECMHNNTTKVRDIKKYLMTTLYNAPITISNYYTSLVNHDMYGG